MRKETRELFRALNENLTEWEGGYTPQKIQKFQIELANFYDRAGKTVKDPTKFSTHIKMTSEQEEELLALADRMGDISTDMGEYEEFYRKNKERFEFTEFDDALKFIDNMENYRADALLSEVISSEQIQELYNEGSIKGISPEEIDQMLAFEYSFSGKEDNDLYQRILVEIDSYDEGSDKFRYS